MSATLQDVARMAGVHASTVSRVLSGKASIRSETRDRIFAAIRQLDYHPNSNARSLAGGHTGVLALVLDMNLHLCPVRLNRNESSISGTIKRQESLNIGCITAISMLIM